jgi:hypothetical protein
MQPRLRVSVSCHVDDLGFAPEDDDLDFCDKCRAGTAVPVMDAIMATYVRAVAEKNRPDEPSQPRRRR